MSRRALAGLGLVLLYACASEGARPALAPERGDAPKTAQAVLVEAPPEQDLDAAPTDATTQGAVSGGNWGSFHADSARLGVSTASAITAPALRWMARVGLQGWLNSPLVIATTVLVPSSGTTHNAPDPEEGVYALELATGKQLWFSHFDGDANGAAADDARVYATSDDGNLYALDLKTGNVVWKQAGKGKMYSYPLLFQNLVITGDAGGYVRAFDRESGAPRWAEQLSGAIRGGASSDGSRIYAVSQAGELAAFGAGGRVEFRAKLTRPPWNNKGKDEAIEAYSPPVVTKDALIIPFARDTYYTGLPALLAADKRTGKVAWRARGSQDFGNVRSTPALVGDVLVYAEPYSGDVVGVGASNGRMLYRHTVGACFFPQWSSPAAARDVVYVMRFDGVLHALRANDGKALWRFYLGDSSKTGKTLPPELENQQSCEWELPVGNPAYSPVAIAPDGSVLVGTSEGFLFALGESRKH